MITYRFDGGIADGAEATFQGFLKDASPPPTLWVEHDPQDRGPYGMAANLSGRGCPYKFTGANHDGGPVVANYSVHMNPTENEHIWQAGRISDHGSKINGNHCN